MGKGDVARYGSKSLAGLGGGAGFSGGGDMGFRGLVLALGGAG